MFYRPAPVRLPRSFISNLRTRSFQSDSNAPKFRPYVFIPIHTPLLNVASTGRLYLITQLFFIPVTTNASSAPDIQELSCCHTPFARIFSWASTHRANSRLPGSAKPAANFTKPAPSGCRNLRRNFTPTIGRAGTPSQRLPTSIAVRKLLSMSAATIFPRTQISASSRSLPPAPGFSPQCPRSSPSSAFNKALTSWATAIPRGALVLAEHTYDQRVDQLLMRLAQFGQKKPAPARSWPEPRARLVALDFFAAHGLTSCAANQFRHIAGQGFRETMQGASLLSRSWLKSL